MLVIQGRVQALDCRGRLVLLLLLCFFFLKYGQCFSPTIWMCLYAGRAMFRTGFSWDFLSFFVFLLYSFLFWRTSWRTRIHELAAESCLWTFSWRYICQSQYKINICLSSLFIYDGMHFLIVTALGVLCDVLDSSSCLSIFEFIKADIIAYRHCLLFYSFSSLTHKLCLYSTYNIVCINTKQWIR